MADYRHPVNHGTPGGYVTHRKRGEQACERCKRAWRDYYNRRYRAGGVPRG